MNAQQIQRLRATRERIVQGLADAEKDMQDTASFDESTDIRQLRVLLGQIDAQLLRVEPVEPPKRTPTPASGAEASDGTVVLARIPKSKRAEMRVSVKDWKGRRTVDIRLYYIPKTSETGEWMPSRKGVSIDSSKLGAIVDALHSARQHTPDT